MKHFDCILVGGGLSGLSLAILLAKRNLNILVIEKKSYPFHKVCGEYISMESWNFVKSLGIPIERMQLPLIKKLWLTSVNGMLVEQELDLGGFGISRYVLEKMLADIAVKEGVTLLENTSVFSYEKKNEEYFVWSSAGKFKSTLVCAAFGKHAFGNFYKPLSNAENWIGVKYHIQYHMPNNLIALHNFNGGYCGISKIENDQYCLCYLVKATQLKKYASSIERLEQEVLCENPYLKSIFQEANFVFEKPIAISNVTFSVKRPVCEHVFYIGDGAGTIAPLSGNGMSNAFRSASILSECMIRYFNGGLTRNELEMEYTFQWNKNFKRRIASGRWIQYFFCKPNLTNFFIWVVKAVKPLRLLIIKQTHGEPF